MDWDHVILEALLTAVSAGVVVLVALWTFRREDRKERREIREKTALEENRKHEENARKLDFLVGEQEERPNHSHMETTGPLTAEGIRYNPRLHHGD